jgi:Lrp/AsnC family transcriptional regulator, regulator for asnA, asnC and gidA
MMIGDIDRKLIFALQEDGRTSNVELSQHLGIHVSTISKRIQFLEENDVLKIRALPNPFKLGYSAHAFVAIEVDSNHIEPLCKRLEETFNVNLVVTVFGRFDIMASIYFTNWEKLLNFVSSELSANNGVRSVETFLIKEIKKRYYGLSHPDHQLVKIDDLDQKIIEKLTENGRYKNKHLARELGITPPTCLRRLSRLLSSGVIEIKAVPNPSHLGYAANAFVFLRIEPGRVDEVCDKLQVYKEVFLITSLFNGYDLLVGVNGTSPEELFNFKNKILSIEGIINDDTIIRAQIKKRYYGGFLE